MASPLKPPSDAITLQISGPTSLPNWFLNLISQGLDTAALRNLKRYHLGSRGISGKGTPLMVLMSPDVQQKSTGQHIAMHATFSGDRKQDQHAQLNVAAAAADEVDDLL